jgi:hypothetical protein
VPPLPNVKPVELSSGPRQPQFGRFATCAEWCLVLVIASAFSARHIQQAWHSLNTDFPNYYTTASLVHDRVDTTRAYEWVWLQRQKDHRGIDQPLIGLAPITPISTLAVYPFVHMAPLSAKQAWIILSTALLLGTIVLLKSISGVPLKRIVLVVVLSYPLLVNLLYGQYYVVLLFLLTAACWLSLRQLRFMSGLVIAGAVALKIFPILYLLYFYRKRDWRACAGVVTGLATLTILSIAFFGRQLNIIYLTRVLPAALRGEVLNPYALQLGSFSALLHHLLIYEPQWNPHPVLHSPFGFAVATPLIQMLVLAPILLLISPKRSSEDGTRLEWAAVLLVSLTLSTSPASYLFTLLIFPVILLLSYFHSQQISPKVSVLLMALYFAAGYPLRPLHADAGWHAFLGVPRLYVMLVLCGIVAWFLYRLTPRGNGQLVWGMGLFVVMIMQIVAGIDHQRNLYADYANRLAMADQALLYRSATMVGNTLYAVAMERGGYRAISEPAAEKATQSNSSIGNPAHGKDTLSLAAGAGQQWFEIAGTRSDVVGSAGAIPDAEMPVLSVDHNRLAYLRETSGHARLWIHDLSHPIWPDQPLTPPEYDVLEASFEPEGTLVFSAVKDHAAPTIFHIDHAGRVDPFLSGETRYPATSPDGHWLAFSRMHSGNWALWIADLQTHIERRLTNSKCNFIEPSWEEDSHTLLYASDCGRALGLTALSRMLAAP